MNQGKYVFAQITEFLPRRLFDRIVKVEENGSKKISKIEEDSYPPRRTGDSAPADKLCPPLATKALDSFKSFFIL